MQGERHLFLLTCMVALAITVSLAFNIDMKNTDVYPGEKEDFYGYKVIQFESGVTKGIVISAPLGLNGSGEICKHEINSTKWCFSNTGITQEDKIIPVKLLGLSIAADSTQSQLTVCSPSVAHECNENSYLNSVCYQITDAFQPVSSFTPDFQECTKKTVDLVFLFDGSASMREDEFTQNKVFIVDIMTSLKNSSIKFAAVQFSSEHRKVFDFNDYEAGRAREKLMEEPHMKRLTNTHAALTFVMDVILENPDAGASPDATKVLVLITDGDPSDVDRNNIIKRYDDKNIIRFVIGVKNVTLDKFKAIASEPSDKYAFKIDNYNGLTDILENFQKKIFNMEGSSVARAGDLTGEMSQSGFSAIYYKDKLILGSVGSDNWQGSLQELHDTSSGAPKHGYGRSFPPNKTQVTTEPKRLNQVTSIRDGNMQNDSYMGYSISVGQKNDAPLYFAGAPRFEHRGQVVLFRYNGNWITAQRLDGDQIGSYFGAELCSVDINSDGNTDFLLVGAPLFYHPQEKREGQIYIYTLTDEMQLRSQLNVTVPSMGRFGTTISSLADLNGDGLRDVAVGAPLEDDNGGAVYIYLGHRNNGIRGSFSQRIMGKKIPPGLRFFGQAIDGGMDLGKDGLPDIVIGSQGAAVVLRSRPVFDVKPRLSFLPKEISIDSFNCLAKDKNLPLVTITTCFKVEETTKSGAVAKGAYVTISYTLNVDPMRQTSRGFFNEIENSRTYSNSNLLTKETCHNHTIFMPRCVKDTLSPLIVKLNYSQVDSENEPAILNMDSRRHATVEIPFEKQCAQKETCIADIEVDFNFTTPVLLVSEDNYFNLTVTLSNHGDDSYNTSLTLYYPQGLSFSRMTQLRTESSRQTLHSCHDLEGVLDKTICGISLPVYRSRSAATFTVSFYMTDYEWNDTVSVIVTGKSDNSNMTKRSSQTKTIPVQFDVKLAITVIQDATTYLNFTTEDDKPKKLVTVYKIDNPGLKAFPVTVSLLFPTLLEYDFELSNYQVSIQENKTQCNITNGISEYCLPEKSCKLIQCDYFTLDKESTTEFTLSGDVQFKHLKAYAENIPFLKRYTGDSGEVTFRSFVKVRYDEKRYTLSAHKQGNADNSAQEQSGETGIWRHNGLNMKSANIRVEFIIPADQLLIICTGVGVGFLLLVIITIIMVKLGCFRRRFRSEQELRSLQSASSTKSINQSVAEGKSECAKKAPENEMLLDDGQTNGSKPPADTKEALE